ncbi:MAG TPA: rhodanese-like domain-containing protein [Thermoanaerobaculia bacterium]|nr:rhodanese-like domain-containing protein [Thermoanaerobaculia bacterium]
MDFRRYLLEAGTIVAAAVVCASVANLTAGRERKLAFVADYPNALIVPNRAPRPQPVVTSTASDGAETLSAGTLVPLEAQEPGVVADAAPPLPSVTQTTAAPVIAAPRVPAAAKPAARATDEEILRRFPVRDDVPYVEISGDDAEWLYHQEILFLDARRTNVYDEGHIAGARNFAVWESDIDQKVAALMNEGFDQRKPIVIYCSGGECEDSHMLSQKLWGVFFNNALVYKDGFPDWKRRGNPVRTGGRP